MTRIRALNIFIVKPKGAVKCSLSNVVVKRESDAAIVKLFVFFRVGAPRQHGDPHRQPG